MIIKTKICGKSGTTRRQFSLIFNANRLSVFLIICILTLGGPKETFSNELNPVNLLENSLADVPEHTSISLPATFEQLAKIQLEKWQTQSGNNIDENPIDTAAAADSDLLIADSPETDIGRELWQARISNPKDISAGKNKDNLYRIIEKIRSVRFEPQDESPEPLIAVKPAQKTETDETSSKSNTPQEPEPQKDSTEPPNTLVSKRQDEEKMPARQITDQTLEIFEQLSQQPQQLESPFELAEILFLNGHLKEAAKCYQEALNRMAANEDPHKKKAWILFQMGNCLRSTDQSAAIEMYQQLITQYPDSPWTDMAKARSRLINWYQQDKPEELIAEKLVSNL